MYHDPAALWKEWLKRGLEEDGWPWDWTSLGSVPDPRKTAHAQIIAKAPGVWAADGLVAALELFTADLGQPILVRCPMKNGHRLRPGEMVCGWTGPIGAVLALERVFLNLASSVCGIATATRELVDAVDFAWSELGQTANDPEIKPRIAATRKTLPGYRDLSLHGVIVGGGWSHRYNLAGGILIKENHIAAAGGVRAAIEGVKKIAPHPLRIEVEVRDEQELATAIAVGIDGVMLDNFTPGAIRHVLPSIPESVWVEVSGGLSRETIAQYVIPGVDILSSGSITHSAKGLDLSLLVNAG